MSSMILNILNKKWRSIAFLLIIASMAVASCGGGGGTQVAGGGIGGTGRYSGVVSGFGSVFVNGIEFKTVGTEITVDNNIVTENELRVGMKVQVLAVDNNASSIFFAPEVKGAVTNINTVNKTLTVLGQTILVDGNTIFENASGLAGISAGNDVIISGFFESTGDILATYIEKLDDAPQSDEVRGTVSNHNPISKTFTISGLAVDYNAVPNPPPFDNGSIVEVEGELIGVTLFADELELEESAAEPGQAMEIEDVITQLTSQSDFTVDGQRVNTDAGTVYGYGTVNDIALNVRVEVEGVVNAGGILIADRVEFRGQEAGSIGIKGYVDAVNTGNSTITIFGLTIHLDAGTVFKDESSEELRPFNINNIQVGDFIEVGGFVSGGDIVAVSLERHDDPGFGNEKLDGPVDSENPDISLVILGINADVSGASFKDADDSNISASTFFTIVRTGDIVEVKGSFGGTFTATSAEIEEEH